MMVMAHAQGTLLREGRIMGRGERIMPRGRPTSRRRIMLMHILRRIIPEENRRVPSERAGLPVAGARLSPARRQATAEEASANTH
jgi:hypothetical protein